MYTMNYFQFVEEISRLRKQKYNAAGDVFSVLLFSHSLGVTGAIKLM